MRCKSMLLGGAVVLALSGAAYAQAQQTSPQATPGSTDQINAGSAAGTEATPGTAAPSGTTTTVSHKHHIIHHHGVRHHVRTASERHHRYGHGSSTPAEREATRNLNQQQLQGGTMMNTGTTSPNAAQPAPATMNQPGTQPAAPQPGNANSPGNATSTQPGPQPGSENTPSNANYAQPAAQPGSENTPSNATYSQPPGSQGVQPGNAGYQQPQNAPPAGTPATPATPATPTDQNATPPPANPNPNQPGPSS